MLLQRAMAGPRKAKRALGTAMKAMKAMKKGKVPHPKKKIQAMKAGIILEVSAGIAPKYQTRSFCGVVRPTTISKLRIGFRPKAFHFCRGLAQHDSPSFCGAGATNVISKFQRWVRPTTISEFLLGLRRRHRGSKQMIIGHQSEPITMANF